MTGKSEAWLTPSIHALQYQSVVVGRGQICCGRRDVRIGFALPVADLVGQGKKDAPDPPHSARCESLFACGACTGRV